MRLYVHHEAAPEFTLVVNANDPQATVGQLKKTFIEAYNQKHGPAHALTAINIVNAKGQPYADSVLLRTTFSDRDDVHIQRAGPTASDSAAIIVFDHTLFPKPPRRGQFTLAKTSLLKDLMALLVAQWSVDREAVLLSRMSTPQIPFKAEEFDAPIGELFAGQAKIVLQLHREKRGIRYEDDESGEEDAQHHGHSHEHEGHGHAHSHDGHGHSHGEQGHAHSQPEDTRPLAVQAEDAKNEGNAFLRDGKIKNAIAKYTRAIELQPSKAIYWSNRAEAHLRVEMWREALDDSAQADFLEAKNPKTLFRKGRAFFGLGRKTDAHAAFAEGVNYLNPVTDAGTIESYKKWMKQCEAPSPSTPAAASAPAAAAPAPKQPEGVLHTFVEQSLATASGVVKKGSYRYAAALYQQILEVVPDERNALYNIGILYATAEKYDQAITYLKRGATLYPDDMEHDFMFYWAETLLDAGRHKEAIDLFSACAKRPNLSFEKQKLLSIKVAIGLYKSGQRDAGIQIVQTLLKKDESDVDALLPYGVACLDLGHHLDALRVFLKVLVSKPQDKLTRSYLTTAVKAVGAAAAANELMSLPSPAPALAFLASTIKDYGAVAESSELLRMCLDLKPESTAYVLNYVHVLEVENRYEDAFTVIKKFCTANTSMAVGAISCGQIYNIIAPFESLATAAKLSASDEPAPARTPMGAMIAPCPIDSSLVPYDADKLDCLALWFTLVKILYINGVLHILPALGELIERDRKGRELHLTSVRNEHAYYCCIAQLLQYHALPLPNLPRVYMAGDSHSLTPAWQTINWRSKLVTGLKCWHLRPSSSFFPKNNFYNVVRTIPPRAEVVFMFGEIDCREGIVISVEKLRYNDIAEGAAVTIGFYIEALRALIKEFGWRVYIHPIIPVLNETRHIVKTFNKVLQEKINAAKEITYLNFFEELLDEQQGFNKKWELDGTHMNPAYLECLSRASLALPPIEQKQ